LACIFEGGVHIHFATVLAVQTEPPIPSRNRLFLSFSACRGALVKKLTQNRASSVPSNSNSSECRLVSIWAGHTCHHKPLSSQICTTSVPVATQPLQPLPSTSIWLPLKTLESPTSSRRRNLQTHALEASTPAAAQVAQQLCKQRCRRKLRNRHKYKWRPLRRVGLRSTWSLLPPTSPQFSLALQPSPPSETPAGVSRFVTVPPLPPTHNPSLLADDTEEVDCRTPEPPRPQSTKKSKSSAVKIWRWFSSSATGASSPSPKAQKRAAAEQLPDAAAHVHEGGTPAPSEGVPGSEPAQEPGEGADLPCQPSRDLLSQPSRDEDTSTTATQRLERIVLWHEPWASARVFGGGLYLILCLQQLSKGVQPTLALPCISKHDGPANIP
jgi:hypothetical protein